MFFCSGIPSIGVNGVNLVLREAGTSKVPDHFLRVGDSIFVVLARGKPVSNASRGNKVSSSIGLVDRAYIVWGFSDGGQIAFQSSWVEDQKSAVPAPWYPVRPHTGLVLNPMAGPLFTFKRIGQVMGQPRPCDPQPIGESSSNMAQNSTSSGPRPVCMSWPSDTSPSSGRDTRSNRARRRSMNA